MIETLHNEQSSSAACLAAWQASDFDDVVNLDQRLADACARWQPLEARAQAASDRMQDAIAADVIRTRAAPSPARRDELARETGFHAAAAARDQAFAVVSAITDEIRALPVTSTAAACLKLRVLAIDAGIYFQITGPAAPRDPWIVDSWRAALSQFATAAATEDAIRRNAR